MHQYHYPDVPDETSIHVCYTVPDEASIHVCCTVPDETSIHAYFLCVCLHCF